MRYRTRIKYTPAQKSEMWDRWQRGELLNAIGRVFDRPSSSIFGQLSPTGGIRPPDRKRSDQATWDRALRPKLCKLGGNQQLSRLVAAKL